LQGVNAGCAIHRSTITASRVDIGNDFGPALTLWIEKYVKDAGFADKLQLAAMNLNYIKPRFAKKAFQRADILAHHCL
jgi:hypothetical protein